MITIWKQTLDICDQQFIEVPEGAELLTVQVQHGQPQLWFKCDNKTPKIYQHIRIYGTGNPISNSSNDEKYLATFQIEGGQLVFHVFYS